MVVNHELFRQCTLKSDAHLHNPHILSITKPKHHSIDTIFVPSIEKEKIELFSSECKLQVIYNYSSPLIMLVVSKCVQGPWIKGFLASQFYKIKPPNPQPRKQIAVCICNRHEPIIEEHTLYLYCNKYLILYAYTIFIASKRSNLHQI